MTNIAKSSIPILEANFKINTFNQSNLLVDENDETTKFLFELEDHQLIETVLMKFDYGYSVCISSQVGCNMGCRFCASGLLKKVRDLTADEMILQYLLVNEHLKKSSKGNISNMVIMGIGEPFDNYDNLKSALIIFNDHYGIGLGSRHVTVSTCGLTPRIEQFGKDFPQVNLAISLHAPNDELRTKLMPINKAYSLQLLMKSIRNYLSSTNRRISFEYILLKDINDHDEHIQQLGKLLQGMLCYVNLIVYNTVDENGYQRSNRAKAFIDGLAKYRVMATKRLECGLKIDAACGQLRANKIKS
ncbi:putative dual-specificity RNA methyltransferase RlmN [Bacilli bacterium]|nr:putative dual-specificity RNA methyltransferase RlmN [Bacilli bacterium]